MIWDIIIVGPTNDSQYVWLIDYDFMILALTSESEGC